MASKSSSAGHAMQLAGSASAKTGEIGVAAIRVIARRVGLGFKAAMDPHTADHAEFARMVPEKTRAFSEAGLISMRSSAEIGARMCGFLAAEMVTLSQTMLAISRCTTAAGVMEIQSRFFTAWMTRAVSQSQTLGSLALRSQSAAMNPIHRTVTGNARRLNA